MTCLRALSRHLGAWLCVVGLSAAFAGPSESAPSTEVTRGERVRLTWQSGAVPEVGIFESLERDTLFLRLDRDLRRQAVSAGSIKTLEIGEGYRAHKSKGTILGLLIGAAAGAAIGVASKEGGNSDNDVYFPLGGSIAGGLGGLVLGVGIGGHHRTDEWKEVRLESVRSGPPTAQPDFRPFLQRNARVRVTAPDFLQAPFAGDVVSVGADTLNVLSDKPDRHTPRRMHSIPVSALLRVETNYGKRGHGLVGMGIGWFAGAGTGAALGAAAGDTGDFGKGGNMAVAAGLLGLAGMTVGGIIGATVKTDRWEPSSTSPIEMGSPQASGLVNAEKPKSHFSVAYGFQKLTDDALSGDAFWPDMTDARYFSLGYRRPLGRRVDLTIDMRHTVSSGTFVSSISPSGWDWLMTTSLFGPGIRFTFSEGRIRPYAQVSLFLAATGGDQPTGYEESGGAGIGASAGIDLGLTRVISIPVEVNYTPIDFVSGYGVNLGLAFHW